MVFLFLSFDKIFVGYGKVLSQNFKFGMNVQQLWCPWLAFHFLLSRNEKNAVGRPMAIQTMFLRDYDDSDCMI